MKKVFFVLLIVALLIPGMFSVFTPSQTAVAKPMPSPQPPPTYPFVRYWQIDFFLICWTNPPPNPENLQTIVTMVYPNGYETKLVVPWVGYVDDRACWELQGWYPFIPGLYQMKSGVVGATPISDLPLFKSFVNP